MSLVSASRLSFRYPTTGFLFRDASFSVNPGDRLAIVGPNGAGKSTLLALLAGAADPTSGEIMRRRGIRVAAVEQTLDVARSRSLFEFVRDVRPPDDYADDSMTDRILDGLGFTAEERAAPLSTLSGGQRTRAALARGLQSDADVLLLDEPTNHPDIAAREWLGEQLAERTIVFVSHDRTLLRSVATRMLEIERGDVTIYEGGYDDYRAHRALRERQAADEFAAFQRRKAAYEQAAERRSRLAVQVGTAPPGAISTAASRRRSPARRESSGNALRSRAKLRSRGRSSGSPSSISVWSRAAATSH